MKKILYLSERKVNAGTEEIPKIETSMIQCSILASEQTLDAQIAFVIKEAYNGEYTVEDFHDSITPPTETDKLRSDVDYLSMMAGIDLSALEV